MAGQDDVLDTLGVLTQVLDAGGVLLRDHVADGIRNVDGSSTGLDGGFNDAAQEVEVGAGCVLSGELDVRAELLGEATLCATDSSTSSGVIFSLYSMCTGLVARKV